MYFIVVSHDLFVFILPLFNPIYPIENKDRFYKGGLAKNISNTVSSKMNIESHRFE